MRSMFRVLLLVQIAFLSMLHFTMAQPKSRAEIGESMEEYIKENHIDEIESMVHQFATSKVFLEFLLEKGHNIDPETIEIKRKDIRVGTDVDVYVNHFSEHQNFTMIMVPIDIYSQLIYDTLLFSVLEVSDTWLKEKYLYHDISDKSVKEKLLSIENHEILANHMYKQAKRDRKIGIGEVQVKLEESYISSSSIHMHMSDLSKYEKKEFRKSWSIMKKAMAHDIDLNVEMNIYVFGTDDMRISYTSKGKSGEYKMTPRNIFERHQFSD